MILIADSGSTKTDWCLADQGKTIERFTTSGINPYFQNAEEITAVIRNDFDTRLASHPIDEIFFYGAGCANPEKNSIVEGVLRQFRDVPVHIQSDLLGVARSLCGHAPGIACILGTGSNSCFYDGNKIIENISPLGFILGDEGSGAYLGKILVGDLLKKQLPHDLSEKFYRETGLDTPAILERVYRQPFPNRFLASLSPFLLQHIEEPEIYDLVYNGFQEFFTRNVMLYDYEDRDIHFVGSIAFHYKEVLRHAAENLGLYLGSVEISPMEGLVRYHN